MEQAEELKKKGNQYFKDGEYQTAIRYYTKAINADKTNPKYFSNRAKCQQLLGNFEKGIEDAKACIKLDKSFIKAYMIYGICLCEIAKRDASSEQINKAIELIKKSISLCSSKNSRHFEAVLRKRVRRARKLKFLLEEQNGSQNMQNQRLYEEVEVS